MNWLAQIDMPLKLTLKLEIVDYYQWHQKIWDFFPDAKEKKRNELGYLTRIDEMADKTRIWILSDVKPICPEWCPSALFKLKKIANTFLDHSEYVFDIRVNPTKKVKSLIQNSENKYSKNGKREALTSDNDIIEWLNRKAEQAGFVLAGASSLQIVEKKKHFFKKKNNHNKASFNGVHWGVQVRGVLKVEDRERFLMAYKNGIGSAKGFGFGMLLLIPVNK